MKLHGSTNKSLLIKLKTVIAIICLFSVPLVHASVIISATRFIYKSNARDVSVRLTNEGVEPALAQLWIDDGDTTLSPSQINVPFVISTPLVRLDAKQSRSMRIIATNPNLPQDRESMFWLNVLEVPPKPKAADEQNYLQFSVRSRLKLIYRPESLSPDVVAAGKSVKLHIIQNKPLTIRVTNGSANFLNYGEILLLQNGMKTGSTLSATVKPYGSVELNFENTELINLDKGGITVSFSIIDDYGAVTSNVIPLTSAMQIR